MNENPKTNENGDNCSPLPAPVCSAFEDVSDEWDLKTGGERHIGWVSERFWVSVLHRLTGFGWWEWETAIVRIRADDDPEKYKHGKWDDRECLIVRGDYRKELEGKTEEQIMKWYDEHSSERNSMETFLTAILQNVEFSDAVAMASATAHTTKEKP